MYTNISKNVLQEETGAKEFGNTFFKLEQYKKQGAYIAQVLASDLYLAKRGERMKNCANEIVFGRTPGETGAKLVYANFCRDRLCPGCQWRRALKTGQQMREVMRDVASKDNLAFVFVTLTIPSVETAELSVAIDNLNGALRRMLRRKRFKFIKGTYRGIEITRNRMIDSKSFGLWHPHIHMLWAVNPSYFHSRDYVSTKVLQTEWRSCLEAEGSSAANTPFSLQVNIQRVKPEDTDENDYAGAAAELCKYPLKSGDAVTGDIDFDRETILSLAEFAAHRRFISLTGILRESHKRLHLDDIDDPEVLEDIADEAMYFGYKWQPWRSGVWTYEPDARVVLNFFEMKRRAGTSGLRSRFVRALKAQDEEAAAEIFEKLCEVEAEICERQRDLRKELLKEIEEMENL